MLSRLSPVAYILANFDEFQYIYCMLWLYRDRYLVCYITVLWEITLEGFMCVK